MPGLLLYLVYAITAFYVIYVTYRQHIKLCYQIRFPFLYHICLSSGKEEHNDNVRARTTEGSGKRRG